MDGDYYMNTFLIHKMRSLPIQFPVLAQATAVQKIGPILDFIFSIAKYIGIILVIIGCFQMFLAYKDDNAEAQVRAIKFAVIGAVCMSLKAILTASGFIT